jgi:hypothetical protein
MTTVAKVRIKALVDYLAYNQRDFYLKIHLRRISDGGFDLLRFTGYPGPQLNTFYANRFGDPFERIEWGDGDEGTANARDTNYDIPSGTIVDFDIMSATWPSALVPNNSLYDGVYYEFWLSGYSFGTPITTSGQIEVSLLDAAGNVITAPCSFQASTDYGAIQVGTRFGPSTGTPVDTDLFEYVGPGESETPPPDAIFFDDFTGTGEINGRAPVIGWNSINWQSPTPNVVMGGVALSNPKDEAIHLTYGDDTVANAAWTRISTTLNVIFPDASPTEGDTQWDVTIDFGDYVAGTAYEIAVYFNSLRADSPGLYGQCRVVVYKLLSESPWSEVLADVQVNDLGIEPLSAHTIRVNVDDNLQTVAVDGIVILSSTADISGRGGLNTFYIDSGNIQYVDADETELFAELKIDTAIITLLSGGGGGGSGLYGADYPTVSIPAALPIPMRDGYGETYEETRRKVQMSTGPIRIRNRNRVAPRLIDATWTLSQAEYKIFDQWWQLVLKGGVYQFQIQLADEEDELAWHLVRVVGPFEVDFQSGNLWIVKMRLRTLNEPYYVPLDMPMKGTASVGLSASAVLLIPVALSGRATLGITGRGYIAHPFFGKASVGLASTKLIDREIVLYASVGMPRNTGELA